MKISEAIKLLNSGQNLTVVRAIDKRVGHIVLSVKVGYYIGEESLTKACFESIKKRVKLSKDFDKSNSFICTYKLSTI